MTEEQRAREELLPCPFCGSADIDPDEWASLETSGPGCAECGAGAGSVHQSRADNIAAWNSRAAPTESEQPSTGALDRETREEGYRAGYLHALGLARAGVPTKQFERDVGAYMADFAGPRR